MFLSGTEDGIRKITRGPGKVERKSGCCALRKNERHGTGFSGEQAVSANDAVPEMKCIMRRPLP